MEDGNRNNTASTSKSHTAALHLQSKALKILWTSVCGSSSFKMNVEHIYFHSAPKNEDTFEITIPYEENNFEQQGFYNQSDQNFDGELQICPPANVIWWHSEARKMYLFRFHSTCWPVPSQQLLHGDDQPAHPAADLSGEKLVASEADWGLGRGEGLSALSTGSVHLLHKEPSTWTKSEPIQ